MLTLSQTSSLRDVIINAHDPMQNPGQTWIFYKVGQTRLTQANCDSIDPDDPDDPTRLQPCFSSPPNGYNNRLTVHVCTKAKSSTVCF